MANTETKLSKYHLVVMDQDYLNTLKVTISLQLQGRHKLTQITGLNSKKFDLKSITSKLMKTVGGGGSCKPIVDKNSDKTDWVVSIQGDFRIIVKDFLCEVLLINEMNVRIMGV